MRITDLALRLLGSTSGETILRGAAAASGTITLPAGTTDFSATGGASQVVRQSSAGGAFTVGQLAAADVTGALTGNQTITLSGDVAGSGATAITTTLANSGATAGTYNNVTVNLKGLVTTGSNVAYITGNQTITLSGDIAGSGATAITTTLPNVNANVGTFQGLTVNAKGQVTAAANQSYLTAPVANASLATMATNTIKGNNTAGTAAPIDLTIAQTMTLLGAAPLASPSFTGTVTIPAGAAISGYAPLASPTFSGTPSLPTGTTGITQAVNNNSTALATTAYVIGQAATATSPMNGTAAIGTGTTWARVDHVHASDTSRVPIVGGTMTGVLNVNPGVATPSLNISPTVAVNYAMALQVPSGNCYQEWIVTSVRTWSAGAVADGRFAIIDQTASGSPARIIIDTSGNCSNQTGTWAALSDARLKRDVAPYRRGLSEICALQPVEFFWNGRYFEDDGIIHFGLVADDVEPHIPEVTGAVALPDQPNEATTTEFKTVDPGALVYPLINAVKELAARVEALEARLA